MHAHSVLVAKILSTVHTCRIFNHAILQGAIIRAIYIRKAAAFHIFMKPFVC